MNNYKLLLAYDGTRYSGWQKQGNTTNTIQGKLEHIISQLTGEETEIHGSGRTDAGVHAKGQVANFKTKRDLDPTDILQYLNRYLPQDIRVKSVTAAEERFHARLLATGKHYRYQIDNGMIADIFRRKYLSRFSDKDYFYGLCKDKNVLCEPAGQSQTDLPNFSDHRQISYDLATMRAGAGYLLGTQDFKSFCDNKHMKKSTIRTLQHIDITEEDGILTIDFYGDGFLYHMVRILTGTLLEIGIGCRQPEDIPKIVQAKKRETAGFTAPPQGLFLMEVSYK